MGEPTVTVVIPNWNRRDLLVRLLGQLEGTPCIVVDNGSSDGSADAARNLGAQVIPLPSNRGFAYAVNRGVRLARTAWVAVINNDVTLTRTYLSDLYEEARRSEATIACGLLYRTGSDAVVDGSYDLVSRAGCAWRAASGSEHHFTETQTVSFTPFTSVLIRRDLFLQLNGLDELFESYLEDVDFCLRAAALGHKGVFVPRAIGWHEGSSTLGPWSGRMVYLLSRNQVFLAARHLASPWSWPVVAGQLLWGILALRHGAGIAWLRGKWDGLRQAKGLRHFSERGSDSLSVLTHSEKELRQLQAEIGFDWYWRWYFRLIGPVG